MKLDLEIAIDQQTRTCDRTFEGVSDSGCPPVPAGQPRPFLVQIRVNPHIIFNLPCILESNIIIYIIYIMISCCLVSQRVLNCNQAGALYFSVLRIGIVFYIS